MPQEDWPDFSSPSDHADYGKFKLNVLIAAITSEGKILLSRDSKGDLELPNIPEIERPDPNAVARELIIGLLALDSRDVAEAVGHAFPLPVIILPRSKDALDLLFVVNINPRFEKTIRAQLQDRPSDFASAFTVEHINTSRNKHSQSQALSHALDILKQMQLEP